MATLGERLRYTRNQRGFSLRQLAKEAKLSTGCMSRVENDNGDIGSKRLLRVADVLNTSLDYLVRGELATLDYNISFRKIPQALAELAEELELSFRHTACLYDTYQSLRAHVGFPDYTQMEKNDWFQLYNALKPIMNRDRAIESSGKTE